MFPRKALRYCATEGPVADTPLSEICRKQATPTHKTQIVDARAEAWVPWKVRLPDLATLQTCFFALGSALLGVLLTFLVYEALLHHSNTSHPLPKYDDPVISPSHYSKDAVGVAGKTSTAPKSPKALRQARQQARLALLANQLGTRDKSENSPMSSLSTHRIAQQVESGSLPDEVHRTKLLEPGAAEDTHGRSWWQQVAITWHHKAGALEDGQQEHRKDEPAPREQQQGYMKLLAERGIDLDDPDGCAKLLQIPKVAIMFLTVGSLHHEALWLSWFHRAAGVYPLSSLYPQNDCVGGTGMLLDTCTCNTDLARASEHVCMARHDRPILQRQHLFNVYIHRLPSTGDFPKDSIFAGREIAERVPVTWGTHEETEAAINMLRAALQDPLNQKFIQLSESCIPLYPPAAVHQQLMAEKLSRMDSCGEQIHANWRKSFQWTSLSRKLAQLIVEDTEFGPLFKEYCRNEYDEDYMRWRDCFSTEHLFPTLIAYRQLGGDTDCIGNMVSADWSMGGYHPKTYEPDEITPQTFTALRERPELEEGCTTASHLISASEEGYTRASLERANATGACDQVESLWRAYEVAVMAPKQKIVGYQCPLFARKFSNETVSAVYELLTGCDHDLRIATRENCRIAEAKPQDEEPPHTRRLLVMHEV